MRKKIISSLAVAALALAARSVSHAQSYSNAVVGLNPVAYWPLTETTQPPFGAYIATNLGTASASANGYYETWFQPFATGTNTLYYQTNNIVHVAGAIADGDTAMSCTHAGAGTGQYVVFPRFTNGVANPAVTLVPPFAIEVWVYPTTTLATVMPIVNEGRNPVIDASTGYATNYETGFSVGQYQNIFYFATWNNRGADGTKQEADAPLTANQWQHMVINFDGTNQTWFKNGVQVGTPHVIPASAVNAAGERFTPDRTSPLLIGTGSIIGAGNGAGEFGGNIDEVAIYTNTLDATSIQNHYNAATATDNSYVNAVLANNPIIYLRLNEPAMSSASYPTANTYPVANNYGLIGATGNGFYQPGTVPGVAGPPFSGFGPSSRAVAINGFSGAVDIGAGSLPADLNPTNNQPVTVAAWFKGNPADAAARFQEIVGHGNASWRIAMDNNAGNRFNPGNGPELQFASIADIRTNGFIVNDGNWHFVAGVSDGTTDSLYIDGTLAKTGTSVGAIAGSTLDAFLGGDPGFQIPVWNGSVSSQPRYFEGQIAHVAFFTNALNSSQIQGLYNVAGVPPFVLTQPPTSIAANVGVNLTIPVVAKGSTPLAYQWYRTNGTAVAGQTTSALTFNPLATNNAGSYYVVVTNSYGAVTSSVVALTVFGPPLVQQQSLTDVRVFVGTIPTLRVTATGPSLTYQWTVNGSPIAGATNASYVVTNTASVGSSTYNCTITNFAGSNSLSPINVTVLADPTAPYPGQVIADHPVAYFRLGDPDNGTGNNGVIAYDYAGGYNGSYSNTVLGQLGYMPATDSDTAAAFGYIPPGFDNYVGDRSTYLNFGGPNGTNVQFSVEAWVTSTAFQGSDAGLVTIGYGNGGEQFDLDTGGTSARNFRFIVRDASGAAHVVNGTVAPNTGGMWHHVVGVCDEVNGHVYLYVDGTLNGSTTITAGTGILGLTVPLSIGSRLASSGSTDYDSQFVGTIDEVALYNYALSPSQIGAHYLAAGVPPALTQIQPWLLETNSGATASYTVTAVGTAPLAYQWSDNNGVPIPGATTSTLVLPNVQQSQSGTYTVTVTNLYGSSSTNALLTVDLGAPMIVNDLQPLQRTVYEGVQVTYSVQVSGSAPFAYQWYRNGTAVSGATNSSYSFAALLGTNSYYVAITNQYSASQMGGPTFSSTATVTGVAAETLNPADYTYKMKITFTGYNRNETLSDFPVLVRMGTNLQGFAYSQMASPTGGDLRFTDSNGSRVVPHEIDEWNPGGVSPVWVQVPALSSTNDFVWAYWGNPAGMTPPASQTNGAVWVPQSFENLPAYQVVYHLKEGAFPFADSTETYPATNGVAPGATNGIVGTAGYFSGSQYLDAGTVTNLGDAFTLSSWINITPGTADIQTTWANQQGGFGAPGFAFFVNSYQQPDQLIDLATGIGGTPGVGGEAKTAAGAVSFGTWHLLLAAVDRLNGKASFYLDGNSVPIVSGNVYPGFTIDTDVNLGRFTNNNFYFHGVMDEARIQSGTNSANWVWASYMTVAQNSSFENYSAINSSAVALNIQNIGGKLLLTWPNGTLQSAAEVTGTYSDLTGVTSPYTNTPSGAQQFFRVKVR